MKHFFIILTILVALSSCQQKIEKFYYETGELRGETYLLDKKTGIIHAKEYYKNGVLKAEGNFLPNDYSTGHWKEYYSDGMLKWEGEFKEGVRQSCYGMDSLSYLVNREGKIQFEGLTSKDSLEIGKQYKYRIIVDGVSSGEYIITKTDKCINWEKATLNPEDQDLYPYVLNVDSCAVVKTEDGRYVVALALWFPNEDGMITIGGNNNLLLQMYKIPVKR